MSARTARWTTMHAGVSLAEFLKQAGVTRLRDPGLATARDGYRVISFLAEKRAARSVTKIEVVQLK